MTHGVLRGRRPHHAIHCGAIHDGTERPRVPVTVRVQNRRCIPVSCAESHRWLRPVRATAARYYARSRNPRHIPGLCSEPRFRAEPCPAPRFSPGPCPEPRFRPASCAAPRQRTGPVSETCLRGRAAHGNAVAYPIRCRNRASAPKPCADPRRVPVRVPNRVSVRFRARATRNRHRIPSRCPEPTYCLQVLHGTAVACPVRAVSRCCVDAA